MLIFWYKKHVWSTVIFTSNDRDISRTTMCDLCACTSQTPESDFIGYFLGYLITLILQTCRIITNDEL